MGKVKDKYKGKTRDEIVQELQKRPKKYKKVEDHIMDLNIRLNMAIEEGADPLGYMTIKEIAEDIKFLNSIKTKELE